MDCNILEIFFKSADTALLTTASTIPRSDEGCMFILFFCFKSLCEMFSKNTYFLDPKKFFDSPDIIQDNFFRFPLKFVLL